jgi:hypothetical protein
MVMVPPESFSELQTIAWMRGTGPYPGQPATPIYQEPRETPSVYNNPWMAALAAKSQSQFPSISVPAYFQSQASLRSTYQNYVRQGSSASPFQTTPWGYRGSFSSYGSSALKGFGSFTLGAWLKENGAMLAAGIGIAYLAWKLAGKKG